MAGIENLWALVRIAFGNLWYDYGYAVWAAVLGAALAFFGYLLFRAVRCRVPFEGRYRFSPPDEALTQRASESLAAAVTFPTVTGNEEAIKKFGAFLRYRYPLTFSKLEADEIGGGSLLLRWKGKTTGREPVLFAGHLDVVAAPGDEWSHPPFEGFRENGRIWGRGTIDCKHVVVALCEAAERLLADGFEPKRDLYFAFGHDEETGGSHGAAVIAKVLAKKGVKLDMVLDEGGCVVTGFMGNRHAAAALVGVAEKGMCNMRLTARGQEGHASAPGRPTTIGILAEAVCRIEASPMKKRLIPLTKAYFKKAAGCMHFGRRFLCANIPITGGFARRALAKNPAEAALLRTTAAPTMTEGSKTPNVMPQEAWVNLNVRLLHGDTAQSASESLSQLLADLPCTLEVLPGGTEPSAVSDTGGGMFEVLEKTIAERFGGIPVLPTLAAIGTDGRHYEPVCGCVYRFMPFVLSPQELSRMHGTDERVKEESLGAAVEFYEALIRRLA